VHCVKPIKHLMFKRLQKNKLARVTREHKAIARRRGVFYCVEGRKHKGDMESDHILSQHYYPQLRLKLWNLCIRCQDCNRRKSDKFYWEIRSFIVLFRMSCMESVRALTLTSIGIYCYEESDTVLNIINTIWLYIG